MCVEFQKATVSSTLAQTQTALDGETLSPCYSYHDVQAVPRAPELASGGVL